MPNFWSEMRLVPQVKVTYFLKSVFAKKRFIDKVESTEITASRFTYTGETRAPNSPKIQWRFIQKLNQEYE